ncbi:MAG TPA: TolC family protein [Thermoanaerobaculia bacterium]|nr:TolC family protein [Thermoanaerobaculia bacterium]
MRIKVLMAASGALVMGAVTQLNAQGMSLEQAVETALEGSHRMEAARSGVEMARREIGVSRAEFLPELATVVSYSQYSGDVFFSRFIPGAPPTSGSDIGEFDQNKAAILTLSQTLYAGGAYSARTSASRVEHQIAEQSAMQQEDEIILETTQAYFQALLAGKAVEVATTGLRRSETNLESVRSLRQEDEALEVEVLAAEARVAADRHRLLEAQNSDRLARSALNRLLGSEWTAPLDLTGSLADATPVPSSDEALQQALAANPEVVKARHRIELSDAMRKGAGAYRKLKLELETLFSATENDLFFDGTFWGANLNISIPFGKDVRRGGAAVAQAEAKKSLEENTLRDIESGLRLMVDRALTRADEAKQAIGVGEQNLRFHEERYRVTSTAFEENLATFDDLLEDHTALFEAELALYQAQYLARMAEAELRRIAAIR